MVSIDARLTLIALLPLPFVSFTVKYFGSAIHKRFEEIQAQLSDSARSCRRRCPASASSAPTARRRTRSSGSARANDEYVRRNRVLIRLQGMFYPEHDAVPRASARCSCSGSAAAR